MCFPQKRRTYRYEAPGYRGPCQTRAGAGPRLSPPGQVLHRLSEGRQAAPGHRGGARRRRGGRVQDLYPRHAGHGRGRHLLCGPAGQDAAVDDGRLQGLSQRQRGHVRGHAGRLPPRRQRSFDADFMSNVYERPFEVVLCDAVPAENSNPQAVGRHLERLPHRLRRRRERPEGVRRHRRGARVLRGGGVVSQGHRGPGLPLRGHRLRPQVRRRPHAPGGRGGRVLRRHLHREPHHGGLPVPQGAQGSASTPR